VTSPRPTPALLRLRAALGVPEDGAPGDAVRVLRHRGTCGDAAGAGAVDLAPLEVIGVPVVEAACDGACWAAPAATVMRPGHRHRFARLDRGVPDALVACARGACDEPQAGSGESGLTARLGRTDGSLRDALAQGGYSAAALASTLSSSRMVEVIALAGLIRRFDARALTAPVLRLGVAPGTIDAHLIEGDPHRAVEGMLLAAIAGGSRQVRLEVAAAAPGVTSLLGALEEARGSGILDGTALGGPAVGIEIVETLDGPPAASVETLCALTTVFDDVPPPTRLVALAGALPRSGVYEVPVGGAMTWAGVLAMAGVAPGRVQALRLYGARAGETRLLWSDALDAPLDPATLGGEVAVLGWDDDIDPTEAH